MVTLKQLVNQQEFFDDMSDIDIIRTFFVENDMEEEGLQLIYQLTEAKLNKMKRQQRIVKEWTSRLPSKYLYEKYNLETANKLHILELDFLSNGCKLSDDRLEWAKENIPNTKMPKLYFRPLIEWLDDKGIRFKGEEPIKDKTYIRYI